MLSSFFKSRSKDPIIETAGGPPAERRWLRTAINAGLLASVCFTTLAPTAHDVLAAASPSSGVDNDAIMQVWTPDGGNGWPGQELEPEQNGERLTALQSWTAEVAADSLTTGLAGERISYVDQDGGVKILAGSAQVNGAVGDDMDFTVPTAHATYAGSDSTCTVVPANLTKGVGMFIAQMSGGAVGAGEVDLADLDASVVAADTVAHEAMHCQIGASLQLIQAIAADIVPQHLGNAAAAGYAAEDIVAGFKEDVRILEIGSDTERAEVVNRWWSEDTTVRAAIIDNPDLSRLLGQAAATAVDYWAAQPAEQLAQTSNPELTSRLMNDVGFWMDHVNESAADAAAAILTTDAGHGDWTKTKAGLRASGIMGYQQLYYATSNSILAAHDLAEATPGAMVADEVPYKALSIAVSNSYSLSQLIDLQNQLNAGQAPDDIRSLAAAAVEDLRLDDPGTIAALDEQVALDTFAATSAALDGADRDTVIDVIDQARADLNDKDLGNDVSAGARLDAALAAFNETDVAQATQTFAAKLKAMQKHMQASKDHGLAHHI